MNEVYSPDSYLNIARNDVAVTIAKNLPEYSMNLIRIASAFRNATKERNYSPADIMGFFAEEHVRRVLKSMSYHDKRITYDPIPANATTANYFFTKSAWGTIVHSMYGGDEISSIDVLVLAGDLPLIVEVKAKTINDKHLAKLRINPDKVNNRIKPVAEYFGVKACGYLVVVFPMVVPCVQSTSLVTRGALVSSLPVNGFEYSKNVEKAARKEGLWLKRFDTEANPHVKDSSVQLNTIQMPDITFS